MNNLLFNFESLTVYQKALAFSEQIYRLTQSWPKEHLFGITDQFRRATLSIVLNIAEGSSRTSKDFQHFLTISRGSCYESIPLLKIANSLDLISIEQYHTFYNQLREIAQMLSSLRTSLSK